MANAILNFHFDFPHPSLRRILKYKNLWLLCCVAYAWLATPDQGQCVLSSPPHPRPGEQLLGRSWGQGSPRWQNRPEDPCVSIFWKSFKKFCWTHLSNWSPFKGDMPRSDGFFWWKNWLKLIPGTKYEQFLKYAALLIISCSLSVSLSKNPILLFS